MLFDCLMSALWIASSNAFTHSMLTRSPAHRRMHYVAHSRCCVYVAPASIRFGWTTNFENAQRASPSRQPAYRYGTHLLRIYYAKLAQLQPNLCAKVIVFFRHPFMPRIRRQLESFFLPELNSSAFCTGAMTWLAFRFHRPLKLFRVRCVADPTTRKYPSVIRSLIGVTRVFEKCLCTHKRHPNMPADHRDAPPEVMNCIECGALRKRAFWWITCLDYINTGPPSPRSPVAE